MNSCDVVVRFVAALGWCLEALRSHFVSVDRDNPIAPLEARTALGESSRSGRLEGLGSFLLHGVGCRVVLDSGEEVDFDWSEDGDATFDVWRLQKYARSIGFREAEEVDLVAACQRLAAVGMLEDRGAGWFALRS